MEKLFDSCKVCGVLCDGEFCDAHTDWNQCKVCGDWCEDNLCDDHVDYHRCSVQGCDTMTDSDVCHEHRWYRQCPVNDCENYYNSQRRSKCYEHADWDTCYNCGDWFHEDDMNGGYCYDCQPRSSSLICEYHSGYRPDFFSWEDEEKIYFGTELEVSFAGDPEDAAGELDGMMPFHFEEDCSVHNGFEIITDPQTLDYMHAKEEKWRHVFRALNDAGYREHKSCGLHVHISRTAFGGQNRYDDITPHLERFISLVNNLEWADKIARRSENHYSHKIHYKASDKTSRKNQQLASRYCAVNTTNRNTVEVRIFATTGEYETYMAAVEFVAAAAAYTKDCTDIESEDPNGIGFIKFIGANTETYFNLANYIEKMTEEE